MAIKTTRIQPKVALSKLSDADLADYVGKRIADIEVIPAFGTVEPKLPAVKLALTDFNTKLALQRRGDKASTEAKNVARQALTAIVTDLANGCATLANGNTALFLQTGFDVKKPSTKTEFVPTPDGYVVTPGVTGQLLIRNFRVAGALSYAIFCGTAPTDLKYVGTQKGRRLFITGLVPGTLYYVSLQAIGSSNLTSAVSTPATQRSM